MGIITRNAKRKLRKLSEVKMNTNKKNISTALMILLLIQMILGSVMVAQGTEMDFTAFVASFPEGQRGDKPYIDLLMDPGQRQEVTLEVRNLSNVERVLLLEVGTATTSSSGVVSYCPDQVAQPDSTLLFPMEDLVMTPERVVLEPGETKQLLLTIQMPELLFEGVLAGGISISPQFDSEQDVEEVEGMVRNFFAITIPILLRQMESEVHPQLQLNSVTAGHRNSRNAVIINLQNIKPMFINEAVAIVQVSRTGEPNDFWTIPWEGQIAPNSTFNLYVPLGGYEFAGGEYQVEVEFFASNGMWNFTDSFILTEEEAQILNEEDVEQTEASTPWWIFLLIGAASLVLLFAIILVVGWMLKKRSNHKAQLEVEALLRQINHEISQ